MKLEIAIPNQGKEMKFKELDLLSKSMNKKYETENSLIRLGERVGVEMPSIPSLLPTLDFEVLGCGGAPRGRIIEIYGPESSGKTTIALHFIAQEQALGGICAFVDAEHAIDPTYAAMLGVNVDDLFINQPDNGEQAMGIVDDLVKSKLVTLIVVDSVAALVPRAELEGEMGDAHVGLQARLMSQAMRKLTGECARNGVTIIFINQIREKIGVMFGSPETTAGGRALKFYSSIRLDVRRQAAIKSGDVVIGHPIKVKAAKNKCGPPLRETFIDLIYGQGLDKNKDIVEYSIKLGILEKAGAWIKYQGQNYRKDDLAEKADELLLAIKDFRVKAKQNEVV